MEMNLPWLTEELPDEIAKDIFLKLPVISLVRFRCVSKSVSTTIRSPKFIAAHHSLQKRNPDPKILVKLHCSTSRDERTYFTVLSDEFRLTENIQMPFFDDCLIGGPCNGLLCLSHYDRIALLNPSTREFMDVPPSTIRRPPETEMTTFGPVGFGFDPRCGEYKVIRFITNYLADFSDWNNQVELYCLSSNSWREVAAPYENLSVGFLTFGVSENGLCHWWAADGDAELILSFDMRKESFAIAALPEFGEDYSWDFVRHADGAMAVISYPDEGSLSFDLWVMREAWIKTLSIGPLPGIDRPLGFWKNGQLFLKSNKGELLLLDVESGVMKNFGRISARPATMEVIVYAESLVPIHGRTEE